MTLSACRLLRLRSLAALGSVICLAAFSLPGCEEEDTTPRRTEGSNQPSLSVVVPNYAFGGDAVLVEVRIVPPTAAEGALAVATTLPGSSAPAEVRYAAGVSKVDFAVTTSAVSAVAEGTVSVTYGDQSDVGVIALLPEPTSLTLNVTPVAVAGGQSARLAATISPAYPLSILELELSSDRDVVAVPRRVVVPGDSSSVTIDVPTQQTDTPTAAVITGRARSRVATTTLTVNATSTSQLALTVAVNGNGRVTSAPSGIDCGTDCSESYAAGTAVTLTPVPSAGHRFFAWLGDGDCSEGQVTMAGARNCVAVFTPQLAQPPGGSGWVELGAPLTTASEVDPAPALALDGNNPVVAHLEAVAGDVARLHLRRLDGSTWLTLGGGPLNSGTAQPAAEPSIVLAPGGMPYVAWVQSIGTGSNLYVARFNGTAIERVGASTAALNFLAGSVASSPSIALDAQSQPMVAWVENGAVRFKRFDGSNWVGAAGGEGPASVNADRVRLSSFPAGVPVIAWAQGAGATRELKVVRDFTFQPLGIRVNTLAGGAVIDHFGVLGEAGGAIVTWGQGFTPFDVMSRRWDGAAWSQVGANNVVNANRNELVSLATDKRSLAVAWSYTQTNADVNTATVSALAVGQNQWLVITPALVATRATQLDTLALEMATVTSPVVAGSSRNALDRWELRVRRAFFQ